MKINELQENNVDTMATWFPIIYSMKNYKPVNLH